MKQCKKMLAMVLTLAVVLSMLSVVAFAEGVPAFTVSNAAGKAGDEVTVTVDISNNPGFWASTWTVSYDTTRLEKVAYTTATIDGVTLSNQNNNFLWENTDMADVQYDGKVLDLKFKIKEDAPAGDAEITITNLLVGNVSGQTVNFNVVAGKITVEEKLETLIPFTKANHTDSGAAIHSKYTGVVGLKVEGIKITNWTEWKQGGNYQTQSITIYVDPASKDDAATLSLSLAEGQVGSGPLIDNPATYTVQLADGVGSYTASYLVIGSGALAPRLHIPITFKLGCTEHSFADATCTAPKTCTVCGVTEGEADPNAHSYVDGYCSGCRKMEPVVIPFTKANHTDSGAAIHSKFEGVVGLVIEGIKITNWTEWKQGGNYQTQSITIYVDPASKDDAATLSLSLAEGQVGSGPLIDNPATYTVQLADGVGSYTASYLVIGSGGLAPRLHIPITFKLGCTEHTFADATCNTPKTCTVCGVTEGEADSTAHSYADATCITPKTCSVCGATEGEALGHTWVDADCDTPKTCSVCGATEGEALGHTWVDADCDTPKTCSVCGATEGEALGHTWVDADCDTPKICSVCGATEGEALGHTEETVAGKAATCTETGLTDAKKCSVCGETTVAHTVIPALGHTWDKGVVTKQPTYTETGLKLYTCETCGETETKVLNKLVKPSVPSKPATPSKPEINLPFTDVSKTDWYYDSVKQAYENDLIDGMTATTFEPDGSLTVAQAIKLAAALHQMDNNGKVTLKNGKEIWYTTYVDYAITNGIIDKAYGDYTYAQMNTAATRSEFVAIFHGAMDNYAKKNNVADNAIPDVKMTDKNAAEIYEFYRAGILTGNDVAGTFAPNSNIKRSEVAAILIRMFDISARQSVTLK